MEAKASLCGIATKSVFDRSNYQLWAKHVEDLDLWGEVEEDYEIPILLNNLTLTSI
jgi:hypothetical protein